MCPLCMIMDMVLNCMIAIYVSLVTVVRDKVRKIIIISFL